MVNNVVSGVCLGFGAYLGYQLAIYVLALL
jgi:hypothetical protein